MAFSINDIRAQLQFGGARPTLFQVTISNPVGGLSVLKTPFLVQASQIPSSDLGTIEIPYFGRKIRLAGDRTFTPWGVSVINDEDFLIRHAMEEWSNRINTMESNLRVAGNYKTEATVIQYAKDGSTLRIYEFHGIFPAEVSPINLDWAAVDTNETFNVTFQYDYWTVSGPTGTITGL